MRRKGEGDVLVARFSALGDVAMTLPPLYDACRATPGRKFIFLTKAHPAEIFEAPPANLSLLTPDLSEYSGATGIVRLFREIRRDYPQIDTFVDLHDVLRTKLLRPLFRMSGAKVSKIDKRRRARHALTSAKHKHLVQLPPIEDAYREAFERAGIASPKHFTTLFHEALPPLSDKIAPKAKGEQWVAIAPFARHSGKIYPEALMEQVVGLLAADNRRIFIFGFGEQESRVIEGWSRKSSNVVNMAALNLGIATELPLLARCDVMLSMDSANMHLAGLVGLPVATIWGATHPYTGFSGRTADTADALQMQMVCRPCSIYGNRPCRRGDYHCLAGISPERVAAKVEEILDGGKTKKS